MNEQLLERYGPPPPPPRAEETRGSDSGFGLTARGVRAAAGLTLPTYRAGPWTWVVAAGVSLALLGLVVAQLDLGFLAALSSDVSWALVVVGVALFVVESLLSAVRMHIMAGKADGFLTAMRVTAWHGVWLTALPMRLGEAAWVMAMRRAYGWNVATAVACAVAQRLLDMAVVLALLLLALALAVGADEDGSLAVFALAVAAGLFALIGVATLHTWARLFARLVACAPGPARWRRRGLRHLNRARRWLADARYRRALRHCIVPTVLVWTTIIAAYWLLGQAAGLNLSLAEIGFATTAGNLLTALPVQSIGGIGLLEAGFTGIVAWLGAPVATAAAAVVMIRLALIAATCLFWLVVVGKDLAAPSLLTPFSAEVAE